MPQATYATKQDMIDRFGVDELIQLTDDEGSGDIGERKLNRALMDAKAEIDGYLGRYTLPLAAVPSVLVRLSCDIARYFLYSKNMVEVVEKNYKMARETLVSISKGIVYLGDGVSGSSGNEQPAESGGNLIAMQSSPSIFGRDYGGG